MISACGKYTMITEGKGTCIYLASKMLPIAYWDDVEGLCIAPAYPSHESAVRLALGPVAA